MASKTPRQDRLENNLIINGNFDFWQRGTSLALTPGGSDKNYSADRWSGTNFFGSGQYTVSRSTDVPNESSSNYSRLITVDSNIGISLAGHSTSHSIYRFEGYDVANLNNKTVTLAFWAKTNKAGDFSLAMGSNYDTASSRYVTTFTIDQADTWEKKFIKIDIDSNIISETETGQGLFVAMSFADGADRQTSTLNSWISSSIASSSTTANRTDMLLAGSTFQLADVMLIQGDVEPEEFVGAGRNIGEELQLCQRYYQRPFRYASGVIDTATRIRVHGLYPTTMRAVPTARLIPGQSLANLVDVPGADGAVDGVGDVDGFNSDTNSYEFTFDLAESEVVGRPAFIQTNVLEADAEL